MVARLFLWCAMMLGAVTSALYGGYRLVRLLPAYQRWRWRVEGKKNALRLQMAQSACCEVCGKPTDSRNGDVYDVNREKWWCKDCEEKVLKEKPGA